MSAKQLPVTVNLSAYRGDTWSQTFRFLNGTEPLDLTDADVAADMRDGAARTTSMRVTIEDEPGTVTIRLPDDPPPPGPYVYDVEVIAADATTTWVRGRLIVQQDVTNEQP